MKYDIYFHNDFDGRASAAVMRAFLKSRGDDIAHFIPVKYNLIPQWIDERFFEKHRLFKGKRYPAIIVDFPYHPAAAFWFDHHIMPFRKKGWDKRFVPDASHRFEDSYRSACHLVYDSLREGFGWTSPAHLRQLVKWLDVIDFANYRSAQQTIAMKEAALQANAFIEQTNDDHAMTVRTITFLSEQPLSTFIALPQVKKKIANLRARMKASIAFHKQHMVVAGRVGTIDLTGDPTDDLARFAPYYLYPKLQYVIRYHPFPKQQDLFHINAGSNPWLRANNNKNIGSILRGFGGGGHKDVGGVEVRGRWAAETVVDKIIKRLNA